jgi:hypothetical protein
MSKAETLFCGVIAWWGLVCWRGGGSGRDFVVLLLRYKILLGKSASWSMNKVDSAKCSFHTSLELNSFMLHFFSMYVEM